ncbi:hypothetical protein KIPE111705_04500 [Kibdelosporangium persicum]|uniref:Uncharacterized protein n=1 Tax=Kibdelosporangium persicum TaxID=2698649 RepID=A0ABX2F6H0_9PSEU|nr:hypothetical protein [Kibdelosporangium persicum]NRN66482.1 hypothetical protein [Kibdelosporangium persicum]
MDERELRAAMDRAVSVAPPPMRDEPVLTAGRQALKRHRAIRASAGSAAVVAIVAVGVAVLAPPQGRDGGVPVGGAQLPTVQDKPASSPTGRTNATATAGPHYDRGVALAATLDDLAPAGYGTPDDLKGVDDYADRTLKSHTAMSAGVVNGTEVWNYAAGTPLTKGEGVGELLATVYSRGWETTGEGCALSPVAWDAALAHCTEVTVDGKKVAVADITYPAGDRLPPAQWAGYRHADGTVVFVMQSAKVARSGRPALDVMPMTGRQLAAVAVDPRLKPQ